jgi:hypothetical protein
MIRLSDRGGRLCDGLPRREILRVGGLGVLGAGLNLATLSAGAGAASDPLDRSFGRAKSCILLFLMGGPPQHSTWDPKPDAPKEVRGDFGPISTNVPGLMIGELMPRTARVADKICLLRAMSTGDNAHSSSGYYMLTGKPHSPMNFENANPGPPNDSPCLGALLGRVASPRGGLPSAVTLPHRIFNTDGSIWPGQDAGLLGRGSDPWLLNAKSSPEGLRVDEIALPVGLDPERLAGRRSLLDGLRRDLDRPGHDVSGDILDRRTREAFDLLLSSRARAAFRLEAEPEPVRRRYGESPFGQGVLLARRLVEAGVRLVQVNWYRGANEPPANPCWDSHTNESARLKDVLVPPTDQAYSALIEDLAARGLLDETLVVCMAEFGRSPRLDGAGGRNHWGHCFSIALAGGGIRGGQVHGSSDRLGAYPRDGRVRPEDLASTLFHCLGHRPDTEYLDPLGRPQPITRGEVVRAIL